MRRDFAASADPGQVEAPAIPPGVAGLVPATPIILALCPKVRGRRDESASTRVFDALLPGDDAGM